MIATFRDPVRKSIFAVLFAFAGLAHGQETYPTRPIQLIVPFGAGGSTDIVARVVAEKLSGQLGQQVVVENKVGAGGTIASGYVAKAAPDGYTLIFHTSSSAAIVPLVYRNLQYETAKAFRPVSLLCLAPTVMVINKDIPAKNLAEFIAYAKANPGKLSYASSGSGAILHLQGELFQQLTGTKLVHVAYKSFPVGHQDLIAGRIAMLFDNVVAQVPKIKAGQVRALGVSSAERVGIFPDVPPLSEVGMPTFKNGSWFSIFTPAGVPDAIVRKLELASIEAVKDPVVRQRMVDLGTIPVGSTSGELEKHWQAEIQYWRPLVERLNLQLD
jgi:tripartite-type tricarboxylate transporter receptor subunit TctC